MEMQLGWIERLFSRLSALYGAAFGRQWDGVEGVKETWAEKLGGFSAQEIAGALRACDDLKFPPNLPEFVSMCRNEARREEKTKFQEVPLLEQKEVLARIGRLESVMAKRPKYDYRGWAKELIRRHEAGEDLLPIQISMAREALGAEQ